jgi:kynurenine formamidase
MQGCGAGIALALASGGIGTAAGKHDEDEFGEIATLLDGMPDNWGRWGPDDGLGVLNVLGSEDMFEGMNAAMKRGKKRIQRFTLQAPMTGFGIDALHDPNYSGDGTTEDTGDAMFPGRFPARRDNWADASDDTLALTTPPEGRGMAFADDAFVTPLYLQGATHADALGHGWYGDQIYNGRDVAVTHTPRDFDIPVTGIDKLKEDTDDDDDFDPEIGDIERTHGLGEADISSAAEAGVAGRGVLLDIGRYKGSEGPEDNWLPLDAEPFEDANPDAAVTLEDLKATAEWQDVEIREHDILLIRTGAVERTLVGIGEGYDWNAVGEPGLTYSDALVEWIHEMDIPYVGADNLAVEQIYQQVTEDDLNDGRKDLHGSYALPLHGALLRDLGVTINEVMNLRGLAAQCAEDGIYDFLFTAAPLHAEGGSGAPINPVVLKATDEKSEGDEGEQEDDNGNGKGKGKGN